MGEGAPLHFRVVEGGDEDDGDGQTAGVECFLQVQAADFGHLDIENRRFGDSLLHRPKEVAARGEDPHFQRHRFEQPLEGGADGRVIINDGEIWRTEHAT